MLLEKSVRDSTSMALEGLSEPHQGVATEPLASIPPNTASVSTVIVTATRSASAYRVEVPFTDFAGRCFLRGCLCADLFASWIRKKQFQSDAKIESAASWRYHLQVMGWLRSSLGAASCTAVAGCLIPLFAGNTYQTIVPLFFLLVILYVALRFGHIAGIIGTICAALVFEIFLFAPRLSLAIESRSARHHLISMVILGICASELLGRRKAPAVYKPW
jgi:K+-sensing histidine kinase KdpD